LYVNLTKIDVCKEHGKDASGTTTSSGGRRETGCISEEESSGESYRRKKWRLYLTGIAETGRRRSCSSTDRAGEGRSRKLLALLAKKKRERELKKKR